MDEVDAIAVEVVYATAEKQTVIEVAVPRGATLEQSILASGILDQYPEIDIASASVGVFGQPADLNARVGDGDRVEIYRPLRMDPKEARRQRAGKGVRT